MASSSVVTFVVLLASLVAIACASVDGSTPPSPPRIGTVTTMAGIVSSSGPGGLVNQMPFTVRLDLNKNKLRVDLVYYFQTLTLLSTGSEVFFKVGEECDTMHLPMQLDDNPFKDSTFYGQTTLTTQFFRNIGTNLFNGMFDIDEGKNYGVYAKVTDPNFIVRLVVDGGEEEQDTVADVRTIDHKSIPDSTWNIRCAKRAVSGELQPMLERMYQLLPLVQHLQRTVQ